MRKLLQEEKVVDRIVPEIGKTYLIRDKTFNSVLVFKILYTYFDDENDLMLEVEVVYDNDRNNDWTGKRKTIYACSWFYTSERQICEEVKDESDLVLLLV